VAFAGHEVEVAGIGLHDAGGVGVGAGLEGVFAFEFEKQADGLEGIGDLVFVRHGKAMLGAC
jgi:hypothetical protein